MKKFIAIILFIALSIGMCFNSFAEGNSVMPRYNNTLNSSFSFLINENGEAKVNIQYHGFNEVTQGASITVKLEKRFLFAFWNDVAEWSASSENVSDTFQFTKSVGKGTYRATIELQIYGSGGATDVITDQLEYKY